MYDCILIFRSFYGINISLVSLDLLKGSVSSLNKCLIMVTRSNIIFDDGNKTGSFIISYINGSKNSSGTSPISMSNFSLLSFNYYKLSNKFTN